MARDDFGSATSTSNAVREASEAAAPKPAPAGPLTSAHAPTVTEEDAPPMLVTEAAFRAREPKIRAITVLRDGSIDVNAACTRLLGALPQIKAMRPLIEETFRKFNWEAFDDLEGRLHAAHYCNGLWLSKTATKVDLATSAAELDDWIDKLRETCEMLVSFGKVAPEQLRGLGAPTGGYLGKVNDVSRLLGILRRLDPAALNRTMLDPSDLSTIEVALLSFQSAMGKKQVVPVEREEASLLRQQALTYLLESFDEAQRAAFYLHGEQAGKQLVPSPYADRGARKSKSDTDSEQPPLQPSTPPVATLQAATLQTSGEAPQNFVVANPTGLPLTNPFGDGAE